MTQWKREFEKRKGRGFPAFFMMLSVIMLFHIQNGIFDLRLVFFRQQGTFQGAVRFN